jgi:DNA-binding response OmpR family regulator
MQILIAEDEEATAKALKLLLEKAMYSVDIVHNGLDAWDYVCAGSYDVIVLAIAKAVAEGHGGSVSASSPSGKTMTIRVNILENLQLLRICYKNVDRCRIGCYNVSNSN